MTPRVSVIVPVYNAEEYLREAISSLLNQTFTDFEIILIDDGSTDSSAHILDSFTDPRIVRISHPTNMGLIKTLNEALLKAHGEFVVRNDADDVSHPERLKTLVEFMEQNPHVSIAGSGTGFAESQLLLEDSIEPSSSIIRTKDLLAKGLTHSETYRYSNEYDLHVRAVMAGLHIAHVPGSLLTKRAHPKQLQASYESRVHGIELMEIQKKYFAFLVKKLRFLDPHYTWPITLFAYTRITNVVRFNWKKWNLKRKERRFYATPFSKCIHLNCDAQELKNTNVIDLVTVAFNNAETIKWQANLLQKHLRDPFFYTVCDNSSDEIKASEIQKLCASEGIAYIRLPQNSLTRSASHGSALNWIYRNYVQARKAAYFGFLDHDIFPTKATAVMNILDTQPIYGHLQKRSNLWYLWAGLCFFKKDSVQQDLNFMNGRVGGVGLDTGGMNWDPIYSKLHKESLTFPTAKFEKIRQSRDPIASAHDISQDHVEYIGDWIHIFSASGWKTMIDADERDRIIQGIIREL